MIGFYPIILVWVVSTRLKPVFDSILLLLHIKPAWGE